MRFIVKDLMITVLPLEPLAACDAGQTLACTGRCTLDCASCTGGGTRHLDWHFANDPAELAQLKEELLRTLSSVEAHEKALYASLQPTSSDQVDMLKERLTVALKELGNQGQK